MAAGISEVNSTVEVARQRVQSLSLKLLYRAPHLSPAPDSGNGGGFQGMPMAKPVSSPCSSSHNVTNSATSSNHTFHATFLRRFEGQMEVANSEFQTKKLPFG